MDIDEKAKHICRFVKTGDINSFGPLYQAYHDEIVNYIRSYASIKGYNITIDDAELIYDDVLMQIFKEKDIFKCECEDFNS